MAEYREFLQLLSELQREIDRLCQVGKEKLAAARGHDLDKLNECMKQEQAASLSLRGMEQRRERLLGQLGLAGVPLQELPRRCPEEYRGQTGELAEALVRSYTVYQSVQKPDLTLLERDLRAIEKELESRGAVLETEENYRPASAQKPAELRTDFRA